MRNKFEEQLEKLHVEMIQMGALCEDAISTTAKALIDNDRELARRVKPIEREIDQKERDIESLCMKLLLQQQPVARDLRQISSALKMISDLERIGDQASDIAEILPYLHLGIDSENWEKSEDGYYYYKSALEMGEIATELLRQITVSEGAPEELLKRGFSLSVYAESYQQGQFLKDAWQEAWKHFDRNKKTGKEEGNV